MRLPQTQLSRIKNYIHIAQAIILFLAWALTIGVFTASGATDGRTGWFFGLCWLTIPILIYLTMVPLWSRARRFSNVYAFAFLDTFSIALWLSAWASVASYVASGKANGGSCAKWSHGSATKCRLSEATIVLGVVIMLLFIPTAYVSYKELMEYKRTGILPNQDQGLAGVGPLGGAKPTGHHATVEDDAFDSNMNARNDWEIDDFDQEHGHGHSQFQRDPRQGGGNYGYQRAEMHDEDEYTSAMAHSRNQSEVGHMPSYDDLSQVRPAVPGGPLGHEDTEYRSGGYGR